MKSAGILRKDVHVQGETVWHSQVSMELSRAIAEEQTALAAVLSDLKRQKVLCIEKQVALVKLDCHIK